MSKTIEQAPMHAVAGAAGPSGRIQSAGPSNKGSDLSVKHILIALLVFAAMVGLFVYGFHVQQQRMAAHEAGTVVPAPRKEAAPGVSSPTMKPGVSISSVDTERAMADQSAGLSSRHADVYFDFGKSRLRADATAVLQEHATAIKGNGYWAVVIQGYADRHGAAGYNKGLALKRAETVKQFLTELGIPADSMKAVSIGQEAMVCVDSSLTCQRLNRRVHLEFVKLDTPVANAPGPSETGRTETGEPEISASQDGAVPITTDHAPRTESSGEP